MKVIQGVFDVAYLILPVMYKKRIAFLLGNVVFRVFFYTKEGLDEIRCL